MNASTLIAILTRAVSEHGDHPVSLMNHETGNWHPVVTVAKLHPYTGPRGCMNRTQPVNAYAITDAQCAADDLLLNP